MATLHHRTARPARHLSTDPRRRTSRTGRAGLLVAGLTAVAVGLPLVPAGAAPGSTQSEQSERDGAAARVEAIEKRVTEAEEALERMTIEAEAAADAVLSSRVELARAEKEADAAAAEFIAAEQAVERMQDDVATLGRDAYIEENRFGDVAILLDAESPEELLQRAAVLELLGEDRVETLHELEDVEVVRARADQAARAALQRRDAAAKAAADAEARVKERLADAQREFDEMTAEKERLDEELRQAEVRLLELQGARDAAAEQARAQAAEEAAEVAVSTLTAAAGAVAPTTGTVTSCYGPRWGTMHSGVDIAAPIGTPVFSPEDGVVVDAGPASGFGLAVYVQHGDGTITLYGHINQFFVSPGQTVEAGQQIAEVGNRGQSTGPHLHFEVHTGGLYVNRTDPMPWLSSRGISLGGC